MEFVDVSVMLLALPRPLIWLITAFHVFFCVFLILIVLLQQGKGAGDLGSAFGGGPSQANIAAMSSEDLLTRMTKLFAFAFMATSLLLALFGTARPAGVLDRFPEDETAAVAVEEPGESGESGATPATPGTAAAQDAVTPETPAENALGDEE